MCVQNIRGSAPPEPKTNDLQKAQIQIKRQGLHFKKHASWLHQVLVDSIVCPMHTIHYDGIGEFCDKYIPRKISSISTFWLRVQHSGICMTMFKGSEPRR